MNTITKVDTNTIAKANTNINTITQTNTNIDTTRSLGAAPGPDF